MKIYLKPKADISKHEFQFGLVIEGRNKKPDISGLPNFPLQLPKRYASILGWFWPLGILVELGVFRFSWHSKRLMRRLNKYYLPKWYGSFYWFFREIGGSLGAGEIVKPWRTKI